MRRKKPVTSYPEAVLGLARSVTHLPMKARDWPIMLFIPAVPTSTQMQGNTDKIVIL